MVKLAVCEAAADLGPAGEEWVRLSAEIARAGVDAVLLNELPFCSWIATAAGCDPLVLAASQAAHRKGLEHLAGLNATAVLGSRPIEIDGRSVNQGFVWTPDIGINGYHTKQFFPNEDGFWEANWYEPGSQRFELAEVVGLRVGFLLCTDVMFLEWARYYGRQGAHLIVVPRATPTGTTNRWRTVMAAAAITSGCYVASSNRAGEQVGLAFDGHGWVFDPSGEPIVETSPEEPVVVAEIDRSAVEAAQQDYPCYVQEMRE